MSNTPETPTATEPPHPAAPCRRGGPARHSGGRPARRLRRPAAPTRAATPRPRSGTKSATNPLGVAEDAPLEVVIFNGGYGEKYATDVHEPLYKKAFPKAEIKHQSTQAVSTVLQPRFAARQPAGVRQQLRREADGLRRAGRRRAAAGPHRAVGRPVGRRPGQEGPRHRRPRHRRGRLVQRQAVRPVLRLHRLRHLVLAASCSRTTAGRRRRPGPSSPPCSTRSRPRASPRTATPGRTRPTTSGT